MGSEMKKTAGAEEMSYEKIEVNGQLCWATGALIMPKTVPGNLYWYEVYETDGAKAENENEIFLASEHAKGMLCGTVLSIEPIDFQGEDEICFRDINRLEEEPIQTLEGIMRQAEEVRYQEGIYMTGI